MRENRRLVFSSSFVPFYRMHIDLDFLHDDPLDVSLIVSMAILVVYKIQFYPRKFVENSSAA